MTADPFAVSSESFGFLLPLWPDLHTLADEAEQNADKLPDFSTIRLRKFAEAMVCHLFRRHGLSLNSNETQFVRLQLLQHEDLLDRRVLGLFHTIRKLGNIAAHFKHPRLCGNSLSDVAVQESRGAICSFAGFSHLGGQSMSKRRSYGVMGPFLAITGRHKPPSSADGLHEAGDPHQS